MPVMPVHSMKIMKRQAAVDELLVAGGAYGAGLPVWVYRELREAHDRTTARWPAAPWMLARAFAKRMRCQKRVHLQGLCADARKREGFTLVVHACGVPEDDSRPAVVQIGEDRQLIDHNRQ